MATATITSPGEVQAGGLMQINPARQLYLDLSEDRRRDFHEGKRILIVDDIKSTCQRLHRDLSEIYPGGVEYETDPVAAKEKIIAAKRSGRPYDAILLDLFMPGLQGAQLMKDLHEAGAFVPVVVNTASMMDLVVSDTVKQFDTFKTRKQMEDWYAENRRELPRPVLFHDKVDGDLRSLSAKIDVAMRIGRDGLGDTTGFLREFNPMLVEENFSKEVTHKIVEETRNCAAEVGRIISYMRMEFPGAMSSSWWQREGGNVEETLAALGKVSFSNNLGETPASTADNLHKIANSLISIRPPEEGRLEAEGFGEYGSNPAFLEQLKRWREAFSEPYRIISGLFSLYREEQKPEINVPRFLKALVGEAGEVSSQYEDLVIQGDKTFLKSLIQGVVEAVKKRASQSPGSKMKATVHWVRDLSDHNLREDERFKLRDRGWEKCCIIQVEDNAPLPSDAGRELGMKLVIDLDSLQNKRKEGFFRVETAPEGGMKIRLVLPPKT